MASAAQRALAIPEIVREVFRWIMITDPLYTTSPESNPGLSSTDNSWRSLCETAALALLPYAPVNRLWLDTAMRCTRHSWGTVTATGRFLQDVLANAPPICRQGLADSVSVATISTVSHRRAAAADAPFRGQPFPNMMMLTIVLGDHSDGIPELCSMLTTKSHVPAIRCPSLPVLTIIRGRGVDDPDAESPCYCGDDGVYGLPDEWRALFKQITNLFPALQFIIIGESVHVDRRTLRQLRKRLPQLKSVTHGGEEMLQV
ncbi:uncharacterized protein N7459_003257 [Penicillium hispanicum]|uniref:uncharacterized protein n=1 Tax=Penicillium hispanicum TaxID=1080232 RepID=UPI0025404131|nr:uncharacterized protein N7459_003257 [Penicillium hispanicum]KAJ5587492.1 hypothetical protein N7459_003257 [Penicillium hispanicum]